MKWAWRAAGERGGEPWPHKGRAGCALGVIRVAGGTVGMSGRVDIRMVWRF